MNINRIETIANSKNANEKIVYFMCSSFRTTNNHSYEYALNLVRELKKELIIILYKEPEENPRNNQFFLNGISNHKEIFKPVSKHVFFYNSFEQSLEDILKNAFHIIKDRGYLLEDKVTESKIKEIAKDYNISLSLVESDVFVPVKHASQKEEYGAYTIRRKIMSQLEKYNDPTQMNPSLLFGEKQALEVLKDFINNKLEHYIDRNDPSKDFTSGLSPYLKYGFISPLTIYNMVISIKGESTDSFIEELIVRRELAYNYVYYNNQYNDFYGMTHEWAYKTMSEHINDEREYIYTKEDYITFNTHDKYFNAAMKDMVINGKMHSYMRMYWAKKIIEWSKTYKEAYDIAISLNNYYFLDGCTPNGYTGVAWCFGKHDRAWSTRPIFGKLRYMNANGLKRKFDIDKYVENMERLT